MSKHKTRRATARGFNQKRAVRNFMVVSALYMTMPPLEAARPVALQGISFSQLDLNRNGFIERQEASRPQFAELLRSADLDKDGRLSEEEFKAAQGAERTVKVKRSK
ncbi:EF-hand domain-containing protein [Uliginosibacterium sp. H3]|uniref:EF-hand domain-containing protein n=1 Tax=Uliginosibacterium silvisoli TaxID=3114758 RepID=A0ABU6KA69_9RHOO|nr:EF-hand domain-containing protein [Uliginosibacterium sp. H3]